MLSRLLNLTFNRNDTNWTIAVNLHAFWIPSTFWMHPLSSHGRRICRCCVAVPASYNWGTVHKRRRGKLLDANCLKWHFPQNETNEESEWRTGILIKQIGSCRQGKKKTFSYQSFQLWLPWHGGEHNLPQIEKQHKNDTLHFMSLLLKFCSMLFSNNM